MIKTIRLVIALTNTNSWSMCQMNIKCAFVNGLLDEEEYVSQPVGVEKEGQENKVYKLHKTFYEL